MLQEKVAGIMGFISKKMLGRQITGSDCSTLFSTGEASPEYRVQFKSLHFKKGVDKLKRVQQRAGPIINYLRSIAYMESCKNWNYLVRRRKYRITIFKHKKCC